MPTNIVGGSFAAAEGVSVLRSDNRYTLFNSMTQGIGRLNEAGSVAWDVLTAGADDDAPARLSHTHLLAFSESLVREGWLVEHREAYRVSTRRSESSERFPSAQAPNKASSQVPATRLWTGKPDVGASLSAGRIVDPSELPHYPIAAWAVAIVRARMMIACFDRQGSTGCTERLSRFTNCLREAELPEERPLAIASLRRTSTRLQGCLRLLNGHRACLARSFAVAAGLVHLGHHCRVAVGHSLVDLGAPTPFHAWVEALGEPVNEPPEVAALYEVVVRYGD